MEDISNQQLPTYYHFPLSQTLSKTALSQFPANQTVPRFCLLACLWSSFQRLCYLFAYGEANSTRRVEVLWRKKKICFSRAPSIDIQVERARKLWAQVESARKFWLQERKKVLSGLNRPEIWTIQKGPLETLLFVSYFRRLLYIFFSQILFQCFINSKDCK